MRQQIGGGRGEYGDPGARGEIGNLGPRGAHEAERHAGDAVEADIDAGVGRIDHLATADVDADVLDRVRP